MLTNCRCKQVPRLAGGGRNIKSVGLSQRRRRRGGSICVEGCPGLIVWTLVSVVRATARDKVLLVDLGITHVVNAADGPRHIDTGPQFYRHTGIRYHGVEAADCRDFDLSPFFTETADFIHAALTQNGKVLVHCARGVSRSAALTLAFLMLKEGLTLVGALQAVRRHRNILPNAGFLHQLRLLDASLVL
ncbi:dual specificity protein phosphatase 13B-like [Antennarius striatus]|uniref:dual specificity protein phosphatase 13B-like n=1 Tax=Antennarius striatus TaxID=241820 RepID=UPI0035AFB4ED